MPIVTNQNLILDDNRLSAVYKELFNKLNKACAWSTSENASIEGTAHIFKGITPTSVSEIACNDMESIIPLKPNQWNSESNPHRNGLIINNKIYYYNGSILTQIGVRDDYIVYTSSSSGSGNGNSALTTGYGLTKSGLLVYINNGSESLVSRNCSGLDNFGSDGTGFIKEGEIYTIRSSTITNMNTGKSDWKKIYCGYKHFGNATYFGGLAIDENNDLYCFKGNSNPIKIDIDNNWKEVIPIKYGHSGNYAHALTNSGNLYYIFQTDVASTDIANVQYNFTLIGSNVKKVHSSYCYKNYQYTQTYSIGMSYDNELIYFNNQGFHIYPDIIVDDVLFAHPNNGNDRGFVLQHGKLLKLSIDSNYRATLSDVNNYTNYIKLIGYATYNSSSSPTDLNYLFCGFRGNQQDKKEKTIVYTVENPSIGNNLYLDNSLTTANKTIINSTETTVTDNNGVVYTRDAAYDTYFENIPIETKTKNLTISDILKATSPGIQPMVNNESKIITQNGTYLPSDGYTGLSPVTVDVQQANLQEKTAIDNGDVYADNEYDGLSKVTVALPLSEKNITQNGTYIASEDNVKGYSSVNVLVNTGNDYLDTAVNIDNIINGTNESESNIITKLTNDISEFLYGEE